MLEAGAAIDARDANGDCPLTRASWYLRPGSIIGMLCYPPFRIHPDRLKQTTCGPWDGSMDGDLPGRPHL